MRLLRAAKRVQFHRSPVRSANDAHRRAVYWAPLPPTRRRRRQTSGRQSQVQEGHTRTQQSAPFISRRSQTSGSPFAYLARQSTFERICARERCKVDFLILAKRANGKMMKLATLSRAAAAANGAQSANGSAALRAPPLRRRRALDPIGPLIAASIGAPAAPIKRPPRCHSARTCN